MFHNAEKYCSFLYEMKRDNNWTHTKRTKPRHQPDNMWTLLLNTKRTKHGHQPDNIVGFTHC